MRRVLPAMLLLGMTAAALVTLPTWASASDDTAVAAPANGLTKAQAAEAVQAAWASFAASQREACAKEIADGVVSASGVSMKFFHVVRGEKPEGGRSLYISLHGGGGTEPRVNDRQWENQKQLYAPSEGVYVAPRAPGDTWDLWHQAHIDPLFDRLIRAFVIAGEVNPDRVYLMGYSAGGDGVYQLAPRMADRFAAAAMMAGHPNETKPDGLRNLPFTLHMGANDAAYKRNEVAAQWKVLLGELAKREADAGRPNGYPHHVELHAGKGHWMDRQDAVAIDWMAKHNRVTRPKHIVWLQDDVTEKRFYWLQNADPQRGDRIEAAIEGQTITIMSASRPMTLNVLLDDAMLDLDREITVLESTAQGTRERFRGRVQRQPSVIDRTLAERSDPRMIFVAEVTVTVGGG